MPRHRKVDKPDFAQQLADHCQLSFQKHMRCVEARNVPGCICLAESQAYPKAQPSFAHTLATDRGWLVQLWLLQIELDFENHGSWNIVWLK